MRVSGVTKGQRLASGPLNQLKWSLDHIEANDHNAGQNHSLHCGGGFDVCITENHTVCPGAIMEMLQSEYNFM